MGERTPADYAIEHGGYLADAVTAFLKVIGEEDVFGEISDHGLRETVSDHLQAMRSGVYEFEKRADRAARTEERGEGEPVASEDQANHDCLAKRRPGEPMFIILGRDPDGHNIVRSWAERRLAAGGDPEHCEMGLATAERMRLYASDPANAPASAPPASAYAPPIREPEISREADWESAEQAARLINPKAWAEKDRLDASAFKGGYSAYLSKRLDESRKLARAILNLAPVAKGVSHDADLSDEFDRPGRLSDATRHSAEGTADPALSGARGVGEGWRPIETAEPKNSERLMVATADTPPVVGEAWWREDYDGKLDLWWAGEGPGDYHADPIRDRNQRVTHWQPLPPPPQEQEEGSARADLSPASRSPTPEPPWKAGAAGGANAKRKGWAAFFEGRTREKSPFPPGRADLLKAYQEGWDAADGASSRHEGGLRDEQSPSPSTPKAGDEGAVAYIVRSDVIKMLTRLAEQHTDLALDGGENARQREGMEAAFTQAKYAVAFMPTADLASPFSGISREDDWHRLWNALGNEPDLAKGLAKLGETRFRAILTLTAGASNAEGGDKAKIEAAEPFFKLAREVITPSNGERPWHADSKDWMVVFSFAGQSVTLGDLRRAAAVTTDGGAGS